MSEDEDWERRTARLARMVHALVGWIFWDPEAIGRYTTLGVPGGLGYLATRAAPIAAAGDDAVVAAMYAWAPEPVRTSMRIARQETTFGALWSARDRAVLSGLTGYALSAAGHLADFRDDLWSAVTHCEPAGRPLFAACLNMPMPEDPTLSAWHALNCLREWRGDTHNAILVAAGLDPVDAVILDSAWAGYPPDWMARSRMWGEDAIASAMSGLESRGLAENGRVSSVGMQYRSDIEFRTDELTARPWKGIGVDRTAEIERILAPAAPLLLERVDRTAGVRYLAAARLHDRARG